LACGSNIELLTQQIREFKPKTVVVEKEEDAKDLSGRYGDINVLWGREGLVQAAKGEGDLILNALVGMRGLEPTLSGIAAGKDIALANKETLVAGGELVMKAVKEKGVNLFPVDSEHSAIFQCLQGNEQNKVHRIILTASGGPFRDYAPEALEHVKLEHALRHPKWDMGPKITIDSATMMNKGLEVIEAKWLFDVDLDQIEVVVHPQSIVHSMVEYEDGAIMAQMGMPDMKVPISYAFTYPQRIVTNVDRVDFYQSIRKMTFEKPDMSKFSCIDLAYEAAKKGGSYPVVLNGANEV
ncbi:MAG: 1-deoxy-D-xylulose-5-phosphate reductoisomerase, partial [Anaerovoracaceae bacterium]